MRVPGWPASRAGRQKLLRAARTRLASCHVTAPRCSFELRERGAHRRDGSQCSSVKSKNAHPTRPRSAVRQEPARHANCRSMLSILGVPERTAADEPGAHAHAQAIITAVADGPPHNHDQRPGSRLRENCRSERLDDFLAWARPVRRPSWKAQRGRRADVSMRTKAVFELAHVARQIWPGLPSLDYADACSSRLCAFASVHERVQSSKFAAVTYGTWRRRL
jgi:hypothetical protein